MNEPALLLRATLKVYGESAADALKGTIRNKWAILATALYLPALLFFSSFAALFGRIIGGFMLGLFTTLLLANYLALLLPAVRGERSSLRQNLNMTRELFSPVLSVVFILFLVQFLTAHLQLELWVRGSLSLAIFVLFNPLPEVLYIEGANPPLATFRLAFEFIRENFPEWLVPHVIVLLPALLVDPESVLIMLGSADPFLTGRVLGGSLLLLAEPSSALVFLLEIAAALAAAFYVMVFRGVLYGKLRGSSRRKRVFQQKF